MIEFVEECRREWRRLGVADAVANEMAADLELDLKEAEAEGVSAEAVLGADAFDPRAFAASWAAERGVLPRALVVPERVPVTVERSLRRWGALIVLALSGLVVLVGAALVVRRSSSVGVVVSPVRPRFALPPQVPVGPMFASHADALAVGIGIVFLIVGLAGVVVTTLYWARSARAPIRG